MEVNLHSTNYFNTLILVSPDCPVTESSLPVREGTIADLQYKSLSDAPNSLTSDDLFWKVETIRNPTTAATDISRSEFFSKARACLRASSLVKTLGWGLYHDPDGKVSLVGCETSQYQTLIDDVAVTKIAGMRSKRATGGTK